MNAHEIRQRFIDYFVKNGHEKIQSSSLVPHDDPTLLFANAGMNQFKDYFTGKANPKNRRAVTIQKCVRAGGKHNDLENVGFTARHHTFFEMMGNFSFGDYFKKEAIKFAWDFLTNELKIPKDKLYVTVHESDQEAADIWHNQESVPKDRIFFLGDADNFWEMGETGPCGPCSEIFYDHGEENSDGADTSKCILADEGRYVEIWNLVFMQYEKSKVDGKIVRNDLPKPSVDTGAGLERISAVMQSAYWNYDTDCFHSIIEKIEELSGKKYSDNTNTGNMRVVADHARACTMLITDGVIPSNEGRGYVLRRIIRRAVKHLDELGVKDVSFCKLIPSVFKILGEEYTDNKNNTALAEKLLKLEEDKFRKTLATGLSLLTEELKKIKEGSQLQGSVAFKLYDTYGFPLDLTQMIAEDHKISVNEKEFSKCMADQREKSKKAQKFSTNEDNKKIFYSIKEKNGATQFKGYDNITIDSKLIAKEEIGDVYALVFENSSFYGESGGQTGDQGEIWGTEGKLATIIDTQKPVDDLFVMYSKDADALEIGQTYSQRVNCSRRELIKRNHSATHLLQSALIKVLGDHVKQAGSMVSEKNLRFDFTQPEAVTADQLKEIETEVNKQIIDSLDVSATITSKDQATTMGAMALFGEKYGDEVRVIKMGEFSTELCGGTHVSNTNEIGQFLILSEASLSSGIRRIEAITSTNAYNYLKDRSIILSQLEKEFNTRADKVFDIVVNLQSEIKDKNKIITQLNEKIQNAMTGELFNNHIELANNLKLTIANAKDLAAKEFRSLSDKYVDKNQNGILLLYGVDDDKISVLLRTHKNNKSINCSEVLKLALNKINGRGGGKPDMAQGSGDASGTDQLISDVTKSFKG